MARDVEAVPRRILTPFTSVLMTGRCRFGEAAQLLGAIWDSGTGGPGVPALARLRPVHFPVPQGSREPAA